MSEECAYYSKVQNTAVIRATSLVCGHGGKHVSVLVGSGQRCPKGSLGVCEVRWRNSPARLPPKHSLSVFIGLLGERRIAGAYYTVYYTAYYTA